MIRDSRTVLTDEQAFDALMDYKEMELHTHYASNAIANGHSPECRTVTQPRNWPTLFTSWPIACTCGLYEDNAEAFRRSAR